MLASRIAKGAIWLVGARLATKTLDLVAMLIVARLLVPADFGLFALAATVLLVMEAVTDLSLSNAIVQMHEPPEAVYDTAFTLNLARGLIVFVVLLAIASPFAHFYGDPRLSPIISAVAAVPVLRSLASPRLAHLQRQLIFRPIFYLESAGKIAAFAASVTAAILTRSHWALVAGMIANPAISTLFSYMVAPYRPAFGLRDWKPIFAFSGWLTLSNTVNTLNWQADRLFIGGQLGPGVLGQYTVGSELASLPTNAPIQPMMQALYAGFSKIKGDQDRLRAAYLLSQSFVLAVALPLGVVVSVFAYPIVDLTVGPDWPITALVLQVLTPVLALQMITGPAQAIAMVTGNTSRIFVRDVWMLIVRLTLIVVGISLAGIVGIIVARVASGLFIVELNISLVKRILGLGVASQLASPWRVYISSIVLALLLYLLGHELNVLGVARPADIPTIATVIAVSLPAYALCNFGLWLFGRPANSIEAKVISAIASFRPLPRVKNADAA